MEGNKYEETKLEFPVPLEKEFFLDSDGANLLDIEVYL